VLLHVALTVDTARMIDGSRLALMRPGAILVNTARLGLLDEEAVAAGLEQGLLGGLGLDARLAAGSPLARLLGDPRMVVTPHIGWYSEASAQTLRERTIGDALERALRPRAEEAPVR
jgi:phosphoglycerate dehydrogenase-like enzyme